MNLLSCEQCGDAFPAVALSVFSVEPNRPVCPGCRVNREGRLDSPELQHYLEQVAIEVDDLGLWSEQERQTARRLLSTMYARVSVPQFAQRFGREAVRSVLEVRRRARFDELRTGRESPCHSCGATSDLWSLPFGLANVKSKTRDWGPTAASVAATVGMALLGGGRSVLAGPSTTTEAHICRMNLVLCGGCKRKNTPMLMSRPSDKTYRLHPLWKTVEAMGFTKFLDPYTLAQFK